MTTANIVLSARDTTKAAFASLDASLRGAGQRLDALNGTVQGFLGLGAVAVFTAGLRGAVNELDRLGDTAPKIGLTTQSLAELGFAAKLSGTDAATLEGAIGKLSTRMADAAGGSKEAAAVFSALGIKVKDATGSLKSGDVVLGEIADKFSTFTDGPERAALAVEIFGKSGRELIPLLTQGSKGIDGLRSEFRALAGDDLGAAAQAAGLFNDSLDRLQTSTGRFSRQILEATLPALTDLVNGLVTTEQSTRNVNVVAEALATVLETVSVVGANVSYVIKQVGNEIGGLAAQAVALATLDLNGFKAIGEAMKADAKSAREAVDAYSAGVLRARELATTLAGIDKSYQALENRRLGGGSASPTQTAPIISKPTTEAQTAYKSISAELEKQAKLLAAQSELGRNLTDGEKFRIDIIERLTSEATKLTASERAALLIQAERVANLKDEEERRQKNVKLAQQAYAAEVEFEEERARAEVEASRARESARTYVQDILLATEEQTRLLELEAGLVNATEQQRGFALEKLRIELQLRKDILEVQRRLQFDAVAQQEAIDRLNADAQAKIANAQKRSILDEFNRTTAQISESLTDALLRGFESGKGFVRNFVDTLKNLFKTLVLTPTIKAIIQPVAGALTGAFGLNGVANAGGIDSVFGTASNVASIANLTTSVSSLVSIGSQVASGAMSVANALGTVFANSTGTGISGLLATNGAFGTAAAGSTAATTSSALSSAAAAGPYVLAAVAALNALGVFRSRKIVDGGLQGELGGQINDYALERRGGTLFNGPSYRVLDRGVSAQNDELQKAYNAIRSTVAGMAEQLGIGNDAIKAFTVQLGNDLIHPDTGGFGIKTQGLTQDEIVKKIEAALVSANEQLAAFALGTTEFTRNGETAAQTMGRLAGSLQTVNSTFDLLGLTLADASLAGADAASKFVELFGGVEQFGQVTSSYYANFYTEAERTANTVEALRQRFYELGVNGATTREEFRALIEEQQRLHGATSPVVAELLKLSDTFASVVPAATSAADAINSVFGAVNTNTGIRAQSESEAIAGAERAERLAGQLLLQTEATEKATIAAEQLKAAIEEQTKTANTVYLTGREDLATLNATIQSIQRQNDETRISNPGGTQIVGGGLPSAYVPALLQTFREDFLSKFSPAVVSAFGSGFSTLIDTAVAQYEVSLTSSGSSGLEGITRAAADVGDAFARFNSLGQIIQTFTGTASTLGVEDLGVAFGFLSDRLGVVVNTVEDVTAAYEAQNTQQARVEREIQSQQALFDAGVQSARTYFKDLATASENLRVQGDKVAQTFKNLEGSIATVGGIVTSFSGSLQAIEAGIGAFSLTGLSDGQSEFVGRVKAIADAAQTAQGVLKSSSGLIANTAIQSSVSKGDPQSYADALVVLGAELGKGTLSVADFSIAFNEATNLFTGQAEIIAQARDAAQQALQQAYQAEIKALDEVISKRDQAVQALDAAFNRESDALQQTIDKFDDLSATLKNFVSDLTGIADNPEQSTARLRANFDATVRAALGGDLDAARNLPGLGRSLVDAAGQTAATRVDLLREIARVQVSTEGVIDFADAQKSIAEQQLDKLREQVSGLLTLDDSVQSVAEAIAALQQATDAANDAEAQKAILNAQVSSLITINESVLSVRDAISRLEQVNTIGVVPGAQIPGFAAGGDFAGGWRMVGERGPELEFTPPSRIFSNSQTNALMDMRGVEMRLERLEEALMVGLSTIAKNTGDTARELQRWDGDGLPETRDITA